MKKTKKKHTLKKRVRRIIFLCIFITIILFSIIFVFISTQALRSLIYGGCEYSSGSVVKSMDSFQLTSIMGVQELNQVDFSSPKLNDWKKNANELSSLKNIIPFMPLNKKCFITVEIGDKVVFSNDSRNEVNNITDPNLYDNHRVNAPSAPSHTVTSMMKTDHLAQDSKYNKSETPSILDSHIFKYYSNITVEKDITDSSGNKIGSVKSNVTPDFIGSILFPLLLIGAVILILVSFLSLFTAFIISRIFTIPIIKPLEQVEQRFQAISNEDLEALANTHIEIKKPLMEIESLVDATNLIIKKMKGFMELLSQQKQVLENQNLELEAQNEELSQSKAAIQEAQTQMVQSQKMASVGQLTAAIAHEINTPLGAIYSNLQICEMLIDGLFADDVSNDPELLKETLNQIRNSNNLSITASKRVTEIIRSLKTFSKLDQAEYQEFDLNEGVRSTIVLTTNLWKNRISIHEELADLPVVKCFPGLLNQVLMNLIVNAIQSIEDNGNIYVKSYFDEEYVYIDIADNGSGISQEYISKIFEPGFTTKSTGIGLGMGLSICNNIMKKHNGELRVESTVGSGTKFTVCVPRRL